MCEFKSGIILKNKVVLAPEGNESHSDLLESLNIEDNHMNMTKVFIRAELIPPDGNKVTSVEEWRYKVDQDFTPDWYDEDPKRYEIEMRRKVKEYMKVRLQNAICGFDWTPIKKGMYTYYFMNGIMFKSDFGKTNDYKTSYIREKLLASDLLLDLKEKFGDRLVSIKLNLVSMDGFKDYGKIEEDLLAIPTVKHMMKFGDKLPLVNSAFFLATPNQTPTRGDSSRLWCVFHDGFADCGACYWDRGVRPFFILKS